MISTYLIHGRVAWIALVLARGGGRLIGPGIGMEVQHTLLYPALVAHAGCHDVVPASALLYSFTLRRRDPRSLQPHFMKIFCPSEL